VIRAVAAHARDSGVQFTFLSFKSKSNMHLFTAKRSTNSATGVEITFVPSPEQSLPSRQTLNRSKFECLVNESEDCPGEPAKAIFISVTENLYSSARENGCLECGLT